MLVPKGVVKLYREWNKDSNLHHSNLDASRFVFADAVLHVLSELQDIPSLNASSPSKIIVNIENQDIRVSDDIYIKVTDFKEEDCVVISVTLLVMSNTLSANGVLEWIKKTRRDYQIELDNSLGQGLYYFDVVPSSMNRVRSVNAYFDDFQDSRRLDLLAAPKYLPFTKSVFVSNKRFEHICGSKAREIETRVKFFLDRKDWYDTRGIPYQMGILLSGIPGSGKTSLIRAIANHAKRHIINVNCSNIVTATQLKNLFQNEILHVYPSGEDQTGHTVPIKLPIHKRLFVLEDIDTLGSIVKQRTTEESETTSLPDELTLGEILNVLDGALESTGRLVIVTSNHPDVLDAALIRPGRIDMNVKFGPVDAEIVAEMYKSYFDESFPENLKGLIPEGKLSPADVSRILFTFCDPVSLNKKEGRAEAVLNALKNALGKEEKGKFEKIPIQNPGKKIISHFRPTGYDAYDL